MVEEHIFCYVLAFLYRFPEQVSYLLANILQHHIVLRPYLFVSVLSTFFGSNSKENLSLILLGKIFTDSLYILLL